MWEDNTETSSPNHRKGFIRFFTRWSWAVSGIPPSIPVNLDDDDLVSQERAILLDADVRDIIIDRILLPVLNTVCNSILKIQLNNYRNKN